jgi:hypothetical protein
LVVLWIVIQLCLFHFWRFLLLLKSTMSPFSTVGACRTGSGPKTR